jgi:glucosamine-6-phosphate deaminase
MKLERIPVRIFETDEQASRAVALQIASLIRQRNQEGKKTVLGLATGHTPVKVYRELIRLHQQDGLDFSRVITFNLDEYWPIQPKVWQSYHYWMHENFFRHVNIPPANIHIPAGDIADEQMAEHCRAYERAIHEEGGIDLQILGIGRTGHIGFNEPGSGQTSRTRRIHLDKITRKDAASDFFGEEHVPAQAITMGVGTIFEARKICLLAFGEHKAKMIQRTVEGEITGLIAASYLQQHPNTTFYLDESSAAELTRIKTPWRVGSCQWDDVTRRQAVVWLANKLEKPILKLTNEDYGENGLAELIDASGGAYQLNIEIFRRQMNTITGWPGGKGGARRVLIFSPHPDDDVICMGGTMMRFIEQGHDLHTAYMVSGHLSVFDHDVSRHADFVRGFNSIFGLTPQQTAGIEEHIDKFLRQKKPGDMDSTEIQAIKGLIRKTEAIEAAKYCGIPEDNVHFLNMPFYDTGTVQKLGLSPGDLSSVRTILEKVRPEILFTAGDLSDPHGTHRLCLEAIISVLPEYRTETGTLPQVWLYRGAWQEWPAEQINMVVPLSPDELKRKRFAIFRHQSQKDRAMFPGPYDSREFWQRAEDRNITTAKIYDALGLPEYHALEAFVRYPVQRSINLTRQFEILENDTPCRQKQ